MSFKKQLLDPIATMSRIINIFFEEKNTKISIHDNILSLQEPTGYQGLFRSFNKDSRENISELYDVIIRIIEWYILPCVQNNNENNLQVNSCPAKICEQATDKTSDDYEIFEKNVIEIEYSNSDEYTDEDEYSKIIENQEIIKLVKYFIKALTKLQETYQNGNVVLALQFYIIILNNALNNNYDEKYLPNVIKSNKHTSLLNYTRLKNIWTHDKIKRICKLYNECFKLYKNANEKDLTMINSYIKSIDSIIKESNNDFQHLIKNSY